MSLGISLPNFDSRPDSNRGDHTLKPGSGIIMRPSWTKSDATVIRPFPCIEGNSFQPARYTESECSKWFFEATMVSSFGNPQKSWIAYDPEDHNYEVRSNPSVMVYDLAYQVANNTNVRGPQEWALAIKGGAGKSATVSKPDRVLIVRCAVYEYKGEPKQPIDGLAPHHQTVFMVLKKSAAQALIRELSVLRSESAHDNVNNKFKSGDVVSLKDGAFLVFYEIGMTPRGYDAPASSSSSYGKPQGKGYDCLISKTYRGQPASFTDAEIEIVARRVANPIRDNLNFPSDEEQIRYVVDSMRGQASHAGLVVHALRDRYERFLPSDFLAFGNEYLRQVGLMATSVANPGYQAQPVLPTYPVPTQQAYQAYAPAQAYTPVPVQAPAQVAAKSAPQAYPDPQKIVSAAASAPEIDMDKDVLMAQLRELRAKAGITDGK
jgi:hypothetical protein